MRLVDARLRGDGDCKLPLFGKRIDGRFWPELGHSSGDRLECHHAEAWL